MPDAECHNASWALRSSISLLFPVLPNLTSILNGFKWRNDRPRPLPFSSRLCPIPVQRQSGASAAPANIPDNTSPVQYQQCQQGKRNHKEGKKRRGHEGISRANRTRRLTGKLTQLTGPDCPTLHFPLPDSRSLFSLPPPFLRLPLCFSILPFSFPPIFIYLAGPCFSVFSAFGTSIDFSF